MVYGTLMGNDKGEADYAQKGGGNGGDTMGRQGIVSAARPRDTAARTRGGLGTRTRRRARRLIEAGVVQTEERCYVRVWGSEVIDGQTARVVARLDSDLNARASGVNLKKKKIVRIR